MWNVKIIVHIQETKPTQAGIKLEKETQVVAYGEGTEPGDAIEDAMAKGVNDLIANADRSKKVMES